MERRCENDDDEEERWKVRKRKSILPFLSLLQLTFR